ncbi:MAG: hypothetical protein H6849_01055 [Alphaproteobacteria bacterium]|nr:MAG: hypothetical protein H6849_01055 [Alphaproteobacteria bacterium]
MIALLEQLSPYLVYAIWGSMLLALIIAIGVIVSASLALKRAAKRRALAPPIPKEDETPPEPQKSLWERFIGFFKGSASDDLALSFDKAIEVLKTYIPGNNFKYEIPWYLMIGAQGSGKTEFLNHVNLELPIGRPDFAESMSNSYCQWWFFDRGIILDTAGDLLVGKKTPHGDDKGWKYLLNLIARHRPRRPLDGIILTIPADELVGANVLTHDELTDRAKQIHQRLWQLQAQLQMKVPVYVVVTKSDYLEGFKEFAHEIPPERRKEIFGWSCPYALDVSYSPQWGYDFFHHMRYMVQKLRGLVFTQDGDAQTREGTFLFRESVESVEKNLRLYMDNIFRDSAYHESFFLRGVYFTGDEHASATNTVIPPRKNIAADSHADTVTNNQQPSPEPPQSVSVSSPPIMNAGPRKIAFVTHLFEYKIFREANLAQPILHILVSTNRALNFAKGMMAVVCLGWFIGLLWVNENLTNTHKLTYPLLHQIHRAVDGVHKLQGPRKEAQRNIFLNEQTRSIINLMGGVSTTKTWSLFIPSSWFVSLQDRINDSLTVAYDDIILAAIHNELRKKGDVITSLSHLEVDFEHEVSASIDPIKLPEFRNLRNYVAEISEYEKHIALYNDIEVSQSIDNVLKLIRYVYDRDFSGQKFQNKSYYRVALSDTTDINVHVQGIRRKAEEKLNQRLSAFMAASFNTEKNLPQVIKLRDQLDVLSRPGGLETDDKDLRNLYALTQVVMQDLSSPTIKWIESSVFNPGEDFSELMTTIASSEILGIAIASQVSEKIRTRFEKFKEELLAMRTPLSSHFFVRANNVLRAGVSDGLKNLHKVLEDFLKQTFMIEDAVVQKLRPVPPGKLLVWDSVTLGNAEKLIDTYTHFVENTMMEIQGQFRAILKFVATNSLRKKILSILGKSQTFFDAPVQFMSYGAQERLNSQVQNIRVVTPQFRKILSVFNVRDIKFKETGLPELLITQTYDMLRRVDKMLDTQDLFSVRNGNFDWWEGETNVGYRAFSVDDQEGLETYLTAQIQRVSYFAKELAHPLLDFLRLTNLEDTPSDLPTIHRWERVLGQLDYYTQKKPGNSVASLEEYVIKNMNLVSMNNCGMQVSEGTGDYFLERRGKIQTLLSKRCIGLSQGRFKERYNRLATFFNSTLSDRFPFTKRAYMPGEREASLRDMHTFYKLMDLLTPYDYELLEKEARRSPLKSRILHFLKFMRASRRLLHAGGNNAQGEDIDGLTFEVDVDAKKKLETQNNFVMRRIFRVGDPSGGHDSMTAIRNGDKLKTFDYYSGDNTHLELQFVKSTANKKYPAPTANHDNAAYEVEEETKALFFYEGQWAMLHLLKENKAEIVTPNAGVERHWTVKIDIPIMFPETPGANGAPPSTQKGVSTIIYDIKLLEKKGEGSPEDSAKEAQKRLLDRALSSLNFPTQSPVIPSDDGLDQEGGGSE